LLGWCKPRLEFLCYRSTSSKKKVVMSLCDARQVGKHTLLMATGSIFLYIFSELAASSFSASEISEGMGSKSVPGMGCM